MNVHRIIVAPTGRAGSTGQRYSASYEGRVIVESSRAPGLAACRALLALGITGRVELWHAGADYPAMRFDIERAARLRVEETERQTAVFRRWKPKPDEAMGGASADARAAA